MRLIDADRLKEVFRRNTGHDYSELIDIQPTVDVLDKIRAEIEHLDYLNIEDGSDGYDKYVDQYDVLQIIDKHIAESGDKA